MYFCLTSLNLFVYWNQFLLELLSLLLHDRNIHLFSLPALFGCHFILHFLLNSSSAAAIAYYTVWMSSFFTGSRDIIVGLFKFVDIFIFKGLPFNFWLADLWMKILRKLLSHEMRRRGLFWAPINALHVVVWIVIVVSFHLDNFNSYKVNPYLNTLKSVISIYVTLMQRT